MKELSVRQSICSYQALSLFGNQFSKHTGILFLVSGFLLSTNSFLFGQQPAAPKQPVANQENKLDVYKELITPEEAVRFYKTKEKKFDETLRAGNIRNNADKKLIAEGARYQVYLMTLKENPHKPGEKTNLNKLTGDIIRDIRFSGSITGIMQAKELYLAELTKRAEDLLDNHRLVRFNAAVLLSKLDLRGNNPRKKQKQIAYTPASVPLLKIIASKDQPTEVKIIAANGLGRIGMLSNAPNATRVKIAEGLVTQLEQSLRENSWYQRSLVNALGSMNITDNLARRPFVVDALLKVMNDPKRTFNVRSTAAYNIGKLPLKANSDIKLITYSIVDLTNKMVAKYNENTKPRFWKRFFWNIYLAFIPVTRNPNFPGIDYGLTQKPVNQTIVNDAFKQIIKPVNIIVQPGVTPKVSAEVTKSMNDWLKKNQPKNFRVAPVQAKLQNQQVAEGK